MILIPFASAWLLRFPPGVPVVESNSLAISAACHPLPGREQEKEAEQLLKYGLLRIDADGVRRVGLSSSSVSLLTREDEHQAEQRATDGQVTREIELQNMVHDHDSWRHTRYK